MSKVRYAVRGALGLGVLGCFVVPAAVAQQAAPELEQIVVTGTRVADRSATDTAVPIDVVSADVLTQQGATELNQALTTALPSFTFPRPGLADGTDTIRPATLRGLAPDQTLVLLNGKRRHRASVISFLGGGISDGAQGPDLSVIPAIALDRVEVLRDGASAQYGSDAIAGVININNIVRGSFLSASLGYYAGAPFAGQGLMREGLELVKGYAFYTLGLHRLEANIQPGNERSIRLVESLGFECEGYSPRFLMINGRWRDHERWALLLEDWYLRLVD